MTAAPSPESPDEQTRRVVTDVLAGRVEPQVHVQPIVDLQRGSIVGHEALARFPGVRPDVAFAADDVGAGYAGMQALLALRPQLLKLDRSLISDLDADPVKQELVRMLGDFAGRMDAWVLAEPTGAVTGVVRTRRVLGALLAAR